MPPEKKYLRICCLMRSAEVLGSVNLCGHLCYRNTRLLVCLEEDQIIKELEPGEEQQKHQTRRLKKAQRLGAHSRGAEGQLSRKDPWAPSYGALSTTHHVWTPER
ncbi:hypothetical protein VIGAN_07240000, partial [Vigna angularis var. angularis]